MSFTEEPWGSRTTCSQLARPRSSTILRPQVNGVGVVAEEFAKSFHTLCLEPEAKELMLDFTCEIWDLKQEARRCARRMSQLYQIVNPGRGKEVQLKKRAATLMCALTRSFLARRLLWLTLIKWAVTEADEHWLYFKAGRVVVLRQRQAYQREQATGHQG